MPTTIRDIAKHTGLSISTVSVALSPKAHKSRIRKETIERVRKAQVELNYRPNILASGLRKGYTNTLGFVMSDISNPFFIKLASVVEQEAEKLGYRVFFAGSDERDEKCKEAIETFVNYQVDGLIIAPTSGISETIKSLQRRKIPFVLIDRYFNGLNANTILMDNFGASYHAVQCLITKGRRHIATFCYETDLCHMKDRFNGYRTALKNNGIRYDKRLTPSISFKGVSADEVKANIKELVENQDVDAFFFQTNQTALPALEFLLLNGYKIPEQISVIGFHDNSFFKLIKPTITALIQPIEDLALESVRLLIKHMGDQTIIERKIFSETQIEFRESL